MDTTAWTILAVVMVAVVALVVFRYRREFSLTFKGWGVKVALSAKGDPAGTIDAVPPERSVTIGRDAKQNRIITGDSASATRAAGAGERSVSIGRDAVGNTIVTGDGNKSG